MLVLLLIILAIIALGSGGWGYSRGWGYYSASPVGMVLLIILALWLAGALG